MSTRSRDIENAAKARRARALDRNELRQPTEPRVAPAGVTSMPVKTMAEADRKLIDEALARRERHG